MVDFAALIFLVIVFVPILDKIAAVMITAGFNTLLEAPKNHYDPEAALAAQLETMRQVAAAANAAIPIEPRAHLNMYRSIE